MKKLSIVIGLAVVSSFTGISAVSASNSLVYTVQKTVDGISFKLSNDTGESFTFFVNGEKQIIKDGQTLSFSFAAGTKIYHSENDKAGALWFEVTESMSGKKFNVSDL